MLQVPSRTILSSARSFRRANEPLIFTFLVQDKRSNLKRKTNFECFNSIVPLLVRQRDKDSLLFLFSAINKSIVCRALFAIRAKANANNSRAGCTCW